MACLMIICATQEGQRIIGDSHQHVVVLFSDIVGFSSLANDLPAIEVFMLVRSICSRAVISLVCDTA